MYTYLINISDSAIVAPTAVTSTFKKSPSNTLLLLLLLSCILLLILLVAVVLYILVELVYVFSTSGRFPPVISVYNRSSICRSARPESDVLAVLLLESGGFSLDAADVEGGVLLDNGGFVPVLVAVWLEVAVV